MKIKSIFIGILFLLFRISNIDRYEKLLESKSNKNQLLMDNLNDKYYLITREILRLLNHGLKDRVTLLCPLPSLELNERLVSLTFFIDSIFRFDSVFLLVAR